jgi:hypothetical protein
MISSPSRLLPRPVIAGIGFASTIPALLADLPARLPGVAISSVIEARARYLEYLRAGEALLASSDTPAAAVSATDLPIENYDGLSLAAIRARLPRLDVVDVENLRDYESTHAKRASVLTMLDNRLAKLARGTED